MQVSLCLLAKVNVLSNHNTKVLGTPVVNIVITISSVWNLCPHGNVCTNCPQLKTSLLLDGPPQSDPTMRSYLYEGVLLAQNRSNANTTTEDGEEEVMVPGPVGAAVAMGQNLGVVSGTAGSSGKMSSAVIPMTYPIT